MQVPIPDFTKLTWHLNIAILGSVFSIFALINDTSFIKYGFITFVYGVVGHFLFTMHETIFKNKSYGLNLFFVTQAVLMAVWIGILVFIYN